MATWAEDVRQQKRTRLSGSENQRTRVAIDRVETSERNREVLRSYIVWIVPIIPVAIAVAKFFLDHGSK